MAKKPVKPVVVRVHGAERLTNELLEKALTQVVLTSAKR